MESETEPGRRDASRKPTSPADRARASKPQEPSPRAVLDDASLTREQKIEKLRRWAADARRVEASNDDGLQGAVTPSNLPAIQEALRELGTGEDPAAQSPGVNP